VNAVPAPRTGLRSVSELTLDLQEHVAGKFSEVWVRGEVTNARRVASGHVYFSLKDPGAILPAVLWRTSAARLKFQLADGIEVVCRGAIDVYPPHGKYQLIVHEVQPLGQGALQIAFEQMKKRLEAEGLFGADRKVKIPYLPCRIAVVTSKTGAAVRDLVTVIHRRFPACEILLVSVRVQGQGAGDDVARGLAWADAHAAADVIVVGRGGGSLEDLWAFNEECVARAIAACTTPVISAVGHEIDVTIADYVADLRAATPSQAGELVVPVRDDLLTALRHREARLLSLVRTKVDRAEQRLQATADRPVLRDPRARIAILRRHVEQLAARLAAADPAVDVARRKEALCGLAARADRAARGTLARALSAYERRRAAVEALSPLRVLDRGYSLTRIDGRLLKSASQATVGAALETETADGVVASRVESVRPARPATAGVSPEAGAPPSS
jgi:exodeoxyribonuclease VII large subunit